MDHLYGITMVVLRVRVIFRKHSWDRMLGNLNYKGG